MGSCASVHSDARAAASPARPEVPAEDTLASAHPSSTAGASTGAPPADPDPAAGPNPVADPGPPADPDQPADAGSEAPEMATEPQPAAAEPGAPLPPNPPSRWALAAAAARFLLLESTPVAVDQRKPAEACGITLAALRELRKRIIASIGPGFTTQQLVDQFIKPTTEAHQCRMADLLPPEHVRPPSYFVSHTWKIAFDFVVQHLEQYAAAQGLPEDTAFWLDVVAVNQHVGAGQEQDLRAFDAAIRNCSATLLVLDAEGTPLTRVWCLRVRRSCYGKNHPLTAMTQAGLSRALVLQRGVGGAPSQHQHPHQQQHQEQQHLLQQQGQQQQPQQREPPPDEARTLAQASLEARERKFGPQHFEVAFSLHALASWHEAAGEPAEAEALYRRAMGIRRVCLEGDHPLVADSAVALARVLLARAEDTGAMEGAVSGSGSSLGAGGVKGKQSAEAGAGVGEKGGVGEGMGWVVEARELLRGAVEALEAGLSPEAPYLAYARWLAAEAAARA
ncbi:hypothetical protein TSOC_002858 [Tetrabaena socialis]|uniref:Nephrocystin-3 n=1 Tax=Tetrabaena socialis TaxID=47790 RepID=A0A2J8AD31_9CHLO|nr:hypothetical protein TSOC_002858 [Tetrabaena socialis]|eukprot:PNH10422.1 hypothetical protein TSOC_002858 [Tetrabaena socialis]